eukprot:3780089-Rhodomonas_salina.1
MHAGVGTHVEDSCSTCTGWRYRCCLCLHTGTDTDADADTDTYTDANTDMETDANTDMETDRDVATHATEAERQRHRDRAEGRQGQKDRD